MFTLIFSIINLVLILVLVTGLGLVFTANMLVDYNIKKYGHYWTENEKVNKFIKKFSI